MNKENKKRYIALKEKVDRIKYPNVPYPVPPLTHERGANDLTKLIKNFLNWQGWQAERINTMGRMVGKKQIKTDVVGLPQVVGSQKYIKGTGTKGSADISATIKGRSVKIEVKYGKDRQSDAQKEYQKHIESAGGIYYIARTFDEFIEYYDKLIKTF
jgi:hypothetical protein